MAAGYRVKIWPAMLTVAIAGTLLQSPTSSTFRAVEEQRATSSHGDDRIS